MDAESMHAWWLPAVLATALLVLLRIAGLDYVLTAAFFDPATQSFPLRHDFWTETVLHDAVKVPVIAFTAALLVSALLPPSHLRPSRGTCLFLLTSMALGSGIVSAIKHMVSTACPKALSMYGGRYPELLPWEALPAGLSPGHCWPGGHSATAFCLFGLYLVLRDNGKRTQAQLALGLVLCLGLLLSAAQVARGAHFASHQVWTALLCWYVSLTLWQVWFRPVARGGSTPS
jgi:membrane-associated PAP2 superfamily phosphatase